MKETLSKIFLTGVCWLASLGLGENLSSLPGGLVYPAFSSSALVNAAALAMDWRTETKLLYSPPWAEGSPHSYLASLGVSNSRLGLNMGYQGSYQEGSAFSGAFAAGAFRLSRLALGFSVRNSDLKSHEPWKKDISAIYKLSYYLRLGTAFYGVGENTQWGLGIGVGHPQKHTLAVDLLIPLNPQGKSLSDQYSLNAALTSYYEKLGFAFGMRFDRNQDGFTNSNSLTGFIGTTAKLSRHLNLTTQYQNNPHTVTVGLVWVWSPPATTLIEYFKAENRKTIWTPRR